MANQYKLIGLYLLPTALITGPFLSDLIVSLYALYFLFFSINKKLYYFYKNYYFYLFLIFYFYILARSLLSEVPLLSLESSLFYFRYYLFVACIIYFINENKNIVFNFGLCLLVPIIILSLDAYLQLITSFNILGWKRPDSLHVTSFFGSEMILGQYIARLTPILIATFFFYDNKQKFSNHFAAYSILILVTSVTYISGERTAFFLSVLSFIMFILLIRDFIKLRFIFSISLIIIIINISFIFPNTHNRIFNHTLTQIGFYDGNYSVFSKKYQSIYETSIKMIRDKPFFGHGPKIYREECKKYKNTSMDPCSTHPHNFYLQLLSEIGIIGTAPFILILLLLIRNIAMHSFAMFISQFKEKYLYTNYEISLLIALLLTFFPLIPSLNIFNNWISIIYYLPVVFLLKLSKV